jgi:hypothetical protein
LIIQLIVFDHSINNWDLSNVTKIQNMFTGAIAFINKIKINIEIINSLPEILQEDKKFVLEILNDPDINYDISNFEFIKKLIKKDRNIYYEFPKTLQ